MKPSPSYLTLNRHGTFYFRIVIPRPLRALLKRQREVRRTLKTDSYRLAQKRARQYAARYEAAFDKVMIVVERDELGLTEADYLEMLELFPDFSSPKDESQPAEPVLSNEEIESRQRRREVDRLLTGAYGRPIPNDQEALAKQLLELSQPYLPTELRRVLPKLRDELVLRKLVPVGRCTNVEEERQPLPSYDPAMANWTLYQVWEHQLARDRADTSSKGGQAKHSGTLEERERRARAMTVLTQHKPVCELSKHDWQAAYDAARKMKANATASLAPSPTPLHEFLTDDPEQMIGHERVSALITSMKQIQNHARYMDLTSIRVDDLIIKPVQKRENKRSRDGVPFSTDDIEAIFSGFIYQGPAPKDRTKSYPFWFWIPLVGFFTGARTNEIAQLDTSDIKEVDGYPCFDFCADDPKAPEAKRIKTGEARQVPIHPRLIELGFLDYVESQRTAKQKKLFGDGLAYLPSRNDGTDHNKEGWAKTAGKFFNEKPKGYLVAIGVHMPHDGKSLYSFRHTLETNLRNARRDGKSVDQTVIDAITGHTPDNVASRHYDGGATIEHKLSALSLLPIPEAIKRLTSYQNDFVDRFGNMLSASIENHRKRRPRQV
ncbi:site-specific integrase [Pseudomonas asiatica]|uniref:site-specific integrase n=1 Tax=Pseudomonas asiatica TaxID=2219225 RepID=UPI0011D73627|nr:site-specific integrase [Pseudomonas asiatica]QOE08401.1 site-specific integrase [Pseudomonas asiatica]TXG96635.1 MAG: site-specific integrase [Nevskiaceae bacterium]